MTDALKERIREEISESMFERTYDFLTPKDQRRVDFTLISIANLVDKEYETLKKVVVDREKIDDIINEVRARQARKTHKTGYFHSPYPEISQAIATAIESGDIISIYKEEQNER